MVQRLGSSCFMFQGVGFIGYHFGAVAEAAFKEFVVCPLSLLTFGHHQHRVPDEKALRGGFHCYFKFCLETFRSRLLSRLAVERVSASGVECSGLGFGAPRPSTCTR